MRNKLFVFVLNNGKIFVGKSPDNDLKKNKIIMQEGIKIKKKDLPEGKNIEKKIARIYFNASGKKKVSFNTYEFKDRNEIEILDETFIYR